MSNEIKTSAGTNLMTFAETTLQAELEARYAASKISPEKRAVMNAHIAELGETGVADHGLKIGQAAPDFTLNDVYARPVTLSDCLRQGPVVLVFYRGEWCPYCNLTLRAYQRALPQFEALGASLIAVSPQTPDNSLTMAEKNDLQFTVLSDPDNVVARQYGLVYSLPEHLREVYLSVNIDLEKANGNDHWELPLPGTFVIDPSGVVKFAFVDANYVRRAEPADLLAALTLRSL